MADVARHIENVTLASNQIPHKLEVAAVSLDGRNFVSNLVDVESVCAALGMQRIQKRDDSSALNKMYGQIAADKAEPSGDQYFFSAILIHV